jgi:hypothetical protein
MVSSIIIVCQKKTRKERAESNPWFFFVASLRCMGA